MEDKNTTHPYNRLEQFVNSLNDAELEYLQFYCWVMTYERKLGQYSVVDNDLGEK